MKRWLRRLTTFSSIALLVTALTACGTIIHPERKGQVSGRIDPAIAVLDGIGLLLYFVPGVIAFAVDFSNGTIYLPDDRTLQLTPEEMEGIVKNGKIDPGALSRVVMADTEVEAFHVVRIDSPDVLSHWKSATANNQ